MSQSQSQWPADIDRSGATGEHPAVRRLSQIHRDMGQAMLRAAASQDEQTSQSDRVADPLAAWSGTAQKTFVVVAIFSIFVNLLMLTIPIYLFQISDRVLTSRGLDTLVMVSGIALGLVATMSMLDILRRQILGRLAASMEVILGGPILAGIVMAAQMGEGGNIQALRSLHQVRGFLASPTMLLLFDAPLAPFYFGVIFFIHPDLGVIALFAALILFAIAVIIRASKFARWVTQIAILGWGAHLASSGEMTVGMMIAASIIAGRALNPLGGLMEGWHSLLQTSSAYARVRTTLEVLQNEKAKSRLPLPAGKLAVERRRGPVFKDIPSSNACIGIQTGRRPRTLSRGSFFEAHTE